MYVYIDIYALRTCYIKLFVVHPKCAYEKKSSVRQILKLFNTKQQHRYGLTLRLLHLMPDCWLEFSLHPEGPLTGEIVEVFQWLSLVLEQTLTWYPNSTLYCSLHPQTLQW
jgi:hypothetical protein